VFGDVITDLLSELMMLGGGTVQLVRERSEETIAIANRRGGVQSKERKLGSELSSGGGCFREEL